MFERIVAFVSGGSRGNQEKSFWVSDSAARVCYECDTPFSLVVRRHHCRICGRIFCARCTRFISLPGAANPTRVCNFCSVLQQPPAPPMVGPDSTTTSSPQATPRASVHASPARDPGLPSAPWQRGLASPARSLRSPGTAGRAKPAWASAKSSGVPAAAARSLPQLAPASPGGLAGREDVTPQLPTRAAAAGLDPTLSMARESLESVHLEHLQSVMRHVFASARLDDATADLWSPVVTRLVWEAAGSFEPSLVPPGRPQHPTEYIDVRVVPPLAATDAGPLLSRQGMADSQVLPAAILEKDLTHRRMARSIVAPRVLCLMGGIEYHRTEARLSSIDTLIEQESQYLSLMVAKVLGCDPHVLLVEKSVARAAQDLLREHGVAVALGLSQRQLERVAWLTGGAVAASVDAVHPRCVGRCARFHLLAQPGLGHRGSQTEGSQHGGQGPDSRQRHEPPLMVFDGCIEGRGCTVVLCGEGDMGRQERLRACGAQGAVLASCARQQMSLLADRIAVALPVAQTLAAVTSRPSASPPPCPASPAPAMPSRPSRPNSLARSTDARAPSPATDARRAHSRVCSSMSATSIASNNHNHGPHCQPPVLGDHSRAPSPDPLSTPETSSGPLAHPGAPRPSAAGSRPSASAVPMLHLAQNEADPPAFEGDDITVDDVLAGFPGFAAWYGPTDAVEAALVTPKGHNVERITPPETARPPQGLSQGSRMRRVWDEDPILESAEPDGQPRAGDGAADGPIAAGADPGRGKPFDAPATPLLELLVDGATGAGKPTVLEWSPLCRVEDVPGAMGDAAVDGSSSGAGTTWAPAPAPLASSLNGGADAAPRVDPVLVSIGQVNPSRGTVCVRPHLQALVPWAPGQDVPLSQFIDQLLPSAHHAAAVCPRCGDGQALHTRVFVHGCARLSITVARMPPGRALPAADERAVWMWVRPSDGLDLPEGARAEVARSIRRARLSPQTLAMSTALFLHTMLRVTGVQVAGVPLAWGFVHYLGLGDTVLRLHVSRIRPLMVRLPGLGLAARDSAGGAAAVGQAASDGAGREGGSCHEGGGSRHERRQRQQGSHHRRHQRSAKERSATASASETSGVSRESAGSGREVGDRGSDGEVPATGTCAGELSAGGAGEGGGRAEGHAVLGHGSTLSGAGAEAGAVGAGTPLDKKAEDALHGEATDLLRACSEAFEALRSCVDGMPGEDYVGTTARDRLERLEQQQHAFHQAIGAITASTLWAGRGGVGAEREGRELRDAARGVGLLAVGYLRYWLGDIVRAWVDELEGEEEGASVEAGVVDGIQEVEGGRVERRGLLGEAGGGQGHSEGGDAGEGTGADEGGGAATAREPPATPLSDGQRASSEGMPLQGPSLRADDTPSAAAESSTAPSLAGPGTPQRLSRLAAKSLPMSLAESPPAGLSSALPVLASEADTDVSHAAAPPTEDPLTPELHVKRPLGSAATTPLPKPSRSLSVATPSIALASAHHPAATPRLGPRRSSLAAELRRMWVPVAEAGAGGEQDRAQMERQMEQRMEQSIGVSVIEGGVRELLNNDPAPEHGRGVAAGVAGAPGHMQQDVSVGVDANALHKPLAALATAPWQHPLAVSQVTEGRGGGGRGWGLTLRAERGDAWGTGGAGTAKRAEGAATGMQHKLGWERAEERRAPAAPQGSSVGVAEAGRVSEGHGAGRRGERVPALAEASAEGGSSARPNHSRNGSVAGSAVALGSERASERGAERGLGEADAAVAPGKAARPGAHTFISNRPGTLEAKGMGLKRDTSVQGSAEASHTRIELPNGVTVDLPGVLPRTLPNAPVLVPIYPADLGSVVAHALASPSYRFLLGIAAQRSNGGRAGPSGVAPGSLAGQSMDAGAVPTGRNSGPAAPGTLASASVSAGSMRGRRGHSVERWPGDALSAPRGVAPGEPSPSGSVRLSAVSGVSGASEDWSRQRRRQGAWDVQEERLSTLPWPSLAGQGDAAQRRGQDGGSACETRSEAASPEKERSRGAAGASDTDGRPQALPLGGRMGTEAALRCLVETPPVHIRYVFDEAGTGIVTPDVATGADAPATVVGRAFQVEAYFALQFEALRELACPGQWPQAAFVESLCRSHAWSSGGGKSGAGFSRSWDERLVLKELSRVEKHGLLQFAPSYFEYVAQGAADPKQGSSFLARILGLFQVTVRVQGMSFTSDVLVMENVLHNRNVSRLYDLKGSLRSRYRDPSTLGHGPGIEVLWDENLLGQVASEPLYIWHHAWHELRAALWRDTAFLESLGVMDYSLLAGVDEDSGELVVGIIDYLRQYTWEKQLETWAKTAASIGAAASAREPTVVSPGQYMRRFRAAMEEYFTVVPSVAMARRGAAGTSQGS